MNIEELSKGQLLLLTILVNFVMSVATGIVTVSLLDQASPNVTQTVNRIVEETVQTVAPASPVAAIVTAPTPAPATPAQPSEQDQIESAISAAAARVVTINSADGSTVIGMGTYLPSARAVVTIRDTNMPDQAVITFANGSTSPVSLSHTDDALAIYGFADAAALPAAPATTLVATSTLKQGQAVLSITGDGSAVSGIISKVVDDQITTSLPETPAGTAAVDLSGNVIGINTGTNGVYASAADVAALLTATSTQ